MKFDASTVQAFIETAVPLMKVMNFKVEKLTPDECIVILPFIDGNKNHLGTMYAGALFSAAEVAGGLVFAQNYDTMTHAGVVKNMNINYLKPAKTNILCLSTFPEEDRTTLDKSLEENGKGTADIKITLTDENQVTVAEAVATYYIKKL